MICLEAQVPSGAAKFVELEALRWENRRLSDARLEAETQACLAVVTCSFYDVLTWWKHTWASLPWWIDCSSSMQ